MQRHEIFPMLWICSKIRMWAASKPRLIMSTHLKISSLSPFTGITELACQDPCCWHCFLILDLLDLSFSLADCVRKQPRQVLLKDYWWRSISGCHFRLLRIWRMNLCSDVRQATKQNSGISLKLHKPNFHSGGAISVPPNMKGKKVDWSIGLDGLWGEKGRSQDRLCATYFPICQPGCLYIAYYWVKRVMSLWGALEFAPVPGFGYLLKTADLWGEKVII